MYRSGVILRYLVREALIIACFQGAGDPAVVELPPVLSSWMILPRSETFAGRSGWFWAGWRLPSPGQGDGTSTHQPVR